MTHLAEANAVAVSDAFVMARAALNSALDVGNLLQSDWNRQMIMLREFLDAVAVGKVSVQEAITYFNTVAARESAYGIRKSGYGEGDG